MDRGMHAIHNISNIYVNASFPKNKYWATGDAVTSLYFMKLMQLGHMDTLTTYMCVYMHTHIHKRNTISFCKETFSVFSFWPLKIHCLRISFINIMYFDPIHFLFLHPKTPPPPSLLHFLPNFFSAFLNTLSPQCCHMCLSADSSAGTWAA